MHHKSSSTLALNQNLHDTLQVLQPPPLPAPSSPFLMAIDKSGRVENGNHFFVTYLMVMTRSTAPFCDFSMSTWALEVSRMLLILHPPRPITRLITLAGTVTFLDLKLYNSLSVIRNVHHFGPAVSNRILSIVHYTHGGFGPQKCLLVSESQTPSPHHLRQERKNKKRTHTTTTKNHLNIYFPSLKYYNCAYGCF